MSTRIDVLMAERRGLLNRLTGLASRELTPEEQTQWDQLTAKVEELDARVSELENVEATEPAIPAPRGMPRLETLRHNARHMPRAPRAPVYGQGSYGRVNDSQILRSWLRVGSPIESDDDRTILARAGFSSNNQAEFRAQTSAAGLGAEVIPTGFFAEVSKTLKAYSRFRDISKVLTTDSGQPLRLPKNDDTSNTGLIISPETTDHSTQDLAFTEVTMGAFTYSSKVVKVSNELLNDSGVDLSSFLGQQLGERIGRAQAAHFVNGTGSGQPQGVVAGATTFAAASATAIALNDIVGLAQSIDPAYLADQGSVYWAMNPAILGALRKLQDTLGRPLLSSIQDGNDTLSLFGYPIVIVPEMDSTMASTKKTVLFGNFQNFLIRDVSTLQVLRTSDRYFEQYATAFLAVYRTDAKVMQSGAFRVLTH